MLQFPEEVLEFDVRGNKYSVSKPTNADLKKYKVDLDKCKTDESKENALKKFLADLGLDITVLDLLTPKQTETLIEALYDAEKN